MWGVVVQLCLYGCNAAVCLGCLAVLVQQILKTSAGLFSLALGSPELAVLGVTVVCLWLLSILGLVGTWRRQSRTLRMYAFMMLVLAIAQMSILWEVYRNLDSSFTDHVAEVVNGMCFAGSETSVVAAHASSQAVGLTETGPGSNPEHNATSSFGSPEEQAEQAANETSAAPRSPSPGDELGAVVSVLEQGTRALQELCECTELAEPRHCISEWVAQRWSYALGLIGLLFALEGMCAVLAWTFVDELDINRLEAKQRQKQQMLQKKEAEKTKQTKTRKKEQKGTQRNAQVPAWGVVSQSLQKITAISEPVIQKAQHEAAVLTQTWYFEGTVLFACLITFLVLALQSKTVPPDARLQTVLNMGEVFFTLFLTAEIIIQLAFNMTSAQRGRILKGKAPWLAMDLIALVSSWAFLVTPFKAFSIGRVLRVLRPIHTLRMLPDIDVILQTIVEAMPLFAETCLLITFLLLAYSLICMSLWSGALSHQCAVDSQRHHANLSLGTEPMLSSAAATTSAGNFTHAAVMIVHLTYQDLIECPACLECPTDEVTDSAWCIELHSPRFIRSEGYGFSGFNWLLQAVLTMFVQMTGDGGMQDIAFALEDSQAILSNFSWSLMFSAVLILTLLALNLFLAVCCSAFDDVHDKIKSKMQHAIENEKHTVAVTLTNTEAGAYPGILDRISNAAEHAKQTNANLALRAQKKQKEGSQSLIEYNLECEAMNWDGKSKAAGCRNCAKRLALSTSFGVVLNLVVLMNTLALMAKHHGMPSDWAPKILLVESICVLVYWFELLAKILGLGVNLYWKRDVHRLDVFVLACASSGIFAQAIVVTAGLLGADAADYAVIGHLHTFSCLRLIRLLRVLQMSRWVYSHKEMRKLIDTVFASWKPIVLVTIFTVFSLAMFAVISMHLLGGSLGPSATIDDYPRRNVETFWNALSVSFQYLTGDNWSEVMYWYMEHSALTPYGVALYMTVQFVWMRCIMFSLFVAVLLVNFSIEEEDKLPRQKAKFDKEEQEAFEAGLRSGSDMLRALEYKGTGATKPAEKSRKGTPLQVLEAFNRASPIGTPSLRTVATDGCTVKVNNLPASMESEQSLQLALKPLGTTKAVSVRVRSEEEKLERNESSWGLVTFVESGVADRFLAGDTDDSLAALGLEVQQFDVGKAQTSLNGMQITAQQHVAKLLALTPEDAGPSVQVDYNRRSLNLFDTSHPVRLFCARVESHPWYHRLVMCIILFSCILVAFESPAMMSKYGDFFNAYNLLILSVLTAQMVLEMIVHGIYSYSGPTVPYLRRRLHRLDVTVILVVAATYLLPAFDLVPTSGVGNRVTQLVRVMAPMVLLLRNKSLRRLMSTFAHSVPAVGAIMLILTLLLLVFGVVGVEYFSGRLHRCVYKDDIYSTVPSHEVQNATQCLAREDTEWRNPSWNFDNIFSALITLFYVLVNAGWLEIAESTFDSTDVHMIPVRNSNLGSWLFFLSFHLVFSFFMLNLFIGVLSSAFGEKNGTNLTTNLQRRWIRVLAMLKTFQVTSPIVPKPDVGSRMWKLRRMCWNIAENVTAERIWTGVILLNVTLLMLDHYPAVPGWAFVIQWANFACLVTFTVEVCIKLVGYGVAGFLQDGWRKMDAVVVLGSWASRFFGVQSGVAVVRAFRTVRLLLLMKRMPGLMALINTVIACISPAVSIAGVSFLVFYIFAVIAMKLFGDIPTDMAFYNDQNNFQTFFSSMKLLFQLINGQDIKGMINDLGSGTEIGWILPFTYLASFFFLTVFICMNLFVVTVLDNFANLCTMDDVEFGPDDLDGYAEVWHNLTYERIWRIDLKEAGIQLDKDMVENLSEEEVADIFAQKREREAHARLHKWAEFRRLFPLPAYIGQHNPMFCGWLHRPSALDWLSDDQRFFWIDGDCTQPDAIGHLCLNWYSEGSNERELDRLHEKDQLVVNRVQIKKLLTEIPAPKEASLATAAKTDTAVTGKIDKMAAALSGRGWLVTLANAQLKYPGNTMAAAFSLPWYDDVLGDMSLPGNSSPPDSPTIGVRMEQEESLSPLQARLRQCIQSGITMPHSSSDSTPGCYACEPEDYADLWPLFSRVIARIHGLDADFIDPDPRCWPEDADRIKSDAAPEEQPEEHTGVEEQITLSERKGPGKKSKKDKSSGKKKAKVQKSHEQNASEKQTSRSKQQKKGKKSKADEGLGKKRAQERKGQHHIAAAMPIIHSVPGDKDSWNLHAVDQTSLAVPENLEFGFDLSSAGLAPMPIRLSAARNLVGFNLIATMQKDDRMTLEDLICDVARSRKFRGYYVSLTPGHPNEIRSSEHEELAAAGLMFPTDSDNPEMEAGGLLTDWPYGRGCWISQDERLSIWVGYEDHVSINAGGMQETDMVGLVDRVTAVLDALEGNEAVVFRHDPDRCGYVTSSLFNCGTGLWAEAAICLPKLAVNGGGRIREVIQELGLDLVVLPKDANSATDAWELRGYIDSLVRDAEVADGGRVRVAVRRTFGVTEAVVVAQLCVGLVSLWKSECEEPVAASSSAEPEFKSLCRGLCRLQGIRSMRGEKKALADAIRAPKTKSADLEIEVEVIPTEAPALLRDAAEIELETITDVKVLDNPVKMPDGNFRHGFTLTVFDKTGINTAGVDTKAGHVKAGGPVEEKFEYYLETASERDAWFEALAAARAGQYKGEAKQAVLYMPNAGWGRAYAPRHCTLSGSGLVMSSSDGTTTIRLVADSPEEKAAWTVALQWLQNNCEGSAPRKDPRMYPGGIPPKPLTQAEWAKIRSQVGLLDLPYTSLRKMLRLLQNRGILDVNDAFSRDFVLYASFQMELHAYRTTASNEAQRNSGIEKAIQAADGLNFTRVLEQLCLMSCGKTNSLPYAELCDSYTLDVEFVAVQIILAAVGAWTALRANDKWADPKQATRPHPTHPIWRRNRAAYRAGVIAFRNQRLRVLRDLRRAIEKDKPQVDMEAFVAREEERRSLESVIATLKGKAGVVNREAEFTGLTRPQKQEESRRFLSPVAESFEDDSCTVTAMEFENPVAQAHVDTDALSTRSSKRS